MSARPISWVVFFACQICSGVVFASEILNAAKHNEMNAVTASIASGANINEQGKQGDTPLHWAAFNGNSQLVLLLIDAGAGVNDRLVNGNTPLHLAAYRAQVAVIETLLENGADATLRNRDGETAWDLARRGRDREATELLARFSRQSQAIPTPGQPPRAAPMVAPEGPARDTSFATFRIQLVAVSSEQRAQRALADYRDRFADILREEYLLLEKANRSNGLLYRVQYGPLSFAKAQILCAELKQREQPCVVKAAVTQ